MNEIDQMGHAILMYCHQAIDPVLTDTGDVDTNTNACLELALCAVATNRDPIALAQKMTTIGYNRVHQCNIDVPVRALEESDWGIESLLFATGLVYYPNWWDLVPYTDKIFAEFDRVFISEQIVSEFEASTADFLDEIGVRVKYPHSAYDRDDLY